MQQRPPDHWKPLLYTGSGLFCCAVVTLWPRTSPINRFLLHTLTFIPFTTLMPYTGVYKEYQFYVILYQFYAVYWHRPPNFFPPPGVYTSSLPGCVSPAGIFPDQDHWQGTWPLREKIFWKYFSLYRGLCSEFSWVCVPIFTDLVSFSLTGVKFLN